MNDMPLACRWIVAMGALVAGLGACREAQEALEAKVRAGLQTIQQRFAPDKRTELFLTEIKPKNDSLVIRVEVGRLQAKEALDSFALTLKNAPVQWHIHLLPDRSVGDKDTAIVNISVCNIRSHPDHAAELVTQALMGMPLKIWKKQGNWYLVQTPDQYLGWVDGGGIQPMTQSQLVQWHQKPKAIFLPLFGMAYQKAAKESIPVTDLVAGNVFAVIQNKSQFWQIALPDGKEAYLPASQCQMLHAWMANTYPTEQSLVATAQRMIGIPYLWGGTSTKGMDCSGFTKTVYWLNGLIIPRDASQQVRVGEEVDSRRDFARLRPGDLLFFGKPATDTTAEKVVHVGMWIGNGEFIHASGKVRISSMNPQAPHFDQYEYKRYLRAKRIIHSKGEPHLVPVQKIFRNPLN